MKSKNRPVWQGIAMSIFVIVFLPMIIIFGIIMTLAKKSK